MLYEVITLTQGNGTLIQLFTAETIKTKALEIVAAKGNMPGVTIAETNSIGKKGCSWKCVKNAAGNSVISVVNLGKGNAKLTIVLKNATIGTACKDLLNGVTIGSTPTLKPNEVLFIEVTDGNGVITSYSIHYTKLYDYSGRIQNRLCAYMAKANCRPLL